MKHILKQWGLAAAVAFSLCGCGNFLEQHSQNMAYLEHVEDLDELLIGECYLEKGASVTQTDARNSYNWSLAINHASRFPVIHLLDDDVEEYLYKPRSETNYARLKFSQLHYWQRDPWRDSEYQEITDNNWGNTYHRIAVLNTILSEVDKFRVADIQKDSTCNRIKGEALFLRAQNYFWLANIYGRPYCKATANTDVCVPLKVNEAIEDRFFSRSPMEDVYGQMRQDLLDAVDAFQGVRNMGVFRANRDATFALLSRVCLYMERYDEAVAYADSVLNTHAYELLDFNARRVNDSSSVMYASSPETIFTQGANIMTILHAPVDQTYKMVSGYTSSADLLACYKDNDLRLKEFFVDRWGAATGKRCIKWRDEQSATDEVSDCMALRLPEVYLNKAEALALLGRDAEARGTLEELRRNRIESDTYESVNHSGGDLVSFIREERRRELCFEGHRWFDLRRYAVNTEYPQTTTVEHKSLVYQDGGSLEGFVQGKYVLNPYDQEPAAWILPVPRTEVEFNEGALMNEERNERPMVD